jgi:hypothetical protein
MNLTTMVGNGKRKRKRKSSRDASSVRNACMIN